LLIDGETVLEKTISIFSNTCKNFSACLGEQLMSWVESMLVDIEFNTAAVNLYACLTQLEPINIILDNFQVIEKF
jgi:hypothetical protein